MDKGIIDVKVVRVAVKAKLLSKDGGMEDWVVG